MNMTILVLSTIIILLLVVLGLVYRSKQPTQPQYTTDEERLCRSVMHSFGELYNIQHLKAAFATVLDSIGYRIEELRAEATGH
jgi:hypothetical protein